LILYIGSASLSVYGKSLFEETHASMVACQVYDILKGLCASVSSKFFDLCSNVDYDAW
jgi:hypothetical protein